jgi:hypothetical protein
VIVSSSKYKIRTLLTKMRPSADSIIPIIDIGHFDAIDRRNNSALLMCAVKKTTNLLIDPPKSSD